MKTNFFASLVVGLATAVTVQGQGLVTFRNAPAGAVLHCSGIPAESGLFVAGLYFNTDLLAIPDLDVPNDRWALAATTPVLGVFGGGIYSAGNTAIPGVLGATEVLLQVRAWETAYSSFEDAFNGSSVVGGSNVMHVTLARPSTTDPVPNLANIVHGFIVTNLGSCIPEPSSLVLCLLTGLGALIFLRRRK